MEFFCCFFKKRSFMIRKRSFCVIFIQKNSCIFAVPFCRLFCIKKTIQ
jgi:hypothetical protein